MKEDHAQALHSTQISPERHPCAATVALLNDHFTNQYKSYCWWTKSCTTNDDDYPIIYRVLTIPGGAGFCPSTVCGSNDWIHQFCSNNLSNLYGCRIAMQHTLSRHVKASENEFQLRKEILAKALSWNEMLKTRNRSHLLRLRTTIMIWFWYDVHIQNIIHISLPCLWNRSNRFMLHFIKLESSRTKKPSIKLEPQPSASGTSTVPMIEPTEVVCLSSFSWLSHHPNDFLWTSGWW